MLGKVYAIRDEKAQAFLQPVCFGTNGLALRWFADLANDKQSIVGRHPSDYVFYEIGSWDDGAGLLASKDHVRLATGSDFIEQVK